MNTAIYIRVSTTGQEERGSSLQTQRETCLALAARLGDAVVAEYQDVDSGAKESIPGIAALIDDARRGRFQRVIMQHPDRFSRSLTKKVVLKRDLAATGVEIRYADVSYDDSAEGRLMENVSAVIAEYERERIALRMTRGRYAKAASGRVVGSGSAPYGYRYIRHQDTTVGLAFDPATAPTVRRIFEALLTTPAGQIADALNAERIPPPRGTRWHQASIAKMAKHPVYKGQAVYGRHDCAGTSWRLRDPSAWVLTDVPAFVDGATWERVQQIIADRRLDRPTRQGDDPYILRGRVTCAHCGGRLSSTAITGRRYYACLRAWPSVARRQGHAGCALPSARAEAVEDLVLRSVRGAVLDTDRLRQSFHDAAALTPDHDTQRDRLDRELTRHRHRLHQAHHLLLDAVPDSEAWSDLRARATEAQLQITRLQGALTQLTAPPRFTQELLESFEAYAATIRDDLDGGDAETQRALLAALDVRVTLCHEPGGLAFGRRRAFGLEIVSLLPIQLGRKNSFSIVASPPSLRIPLATLAG